MFVINIQKKSHSEFQRLLYLDIRFHEANSNGLVIIAIRLKAKHVFRADAMLLFYILQKCNNKSYIFFEYLLPHTKCQYAT
jgi:hypothetical protein